MGPNPRRPGFSRRAQYSLFTGYVVAGAGALLGAILLAASLIRPDAMSGARAVATDVVAPVGAAAAAGREQRHGIFQGISAYISAGSKNAGLRRELEVARVRLAEARAIRAENIRLKQALDLREKTPGAVATARLIGSTSTSTRRLAYLSAGTKQGVRVGMPVRSPLGLVGRVIEAGRDSARVLLLTDSESMVPVRRASDNVVAFAEGRADGTLRIRLINLGINPLKPGDVFVTSGSGGVFQPGIAVAVVSTITRDGAIGRVLSDPLATDLVIAEPVWHPDAQAALARPLAPPVPKPAKP